MKGKQRRIRTEVMTKTRSFHNHHHHFFLILLIHCLMFKVRWQHGRLLTRRTGHVEAYSISPSLRHTLQPSSLISTVSDTYGSRSSMLTRSVDGDQRQATLPFSTSTTLKSSLSSTSINHESSPTTIPVPVLPLGTPRKFVAYPFQVRLFWLGY